MLITIIDLHIIYNSSSKMQWMNYEE